MATVQLSLLHWDRSTWLGYGFYFLNGLLVSCQLTCFYPMRIVLCSSYALLCREKNVVGTLELAWNACQYSLLSRHMLLHVYVAELCILAFLAGRHEGSSSLIISDSSYVALASTPPTPTSQG